VGPALRAADRRGRLVPYRRVDPGDDVAPILQRVVEQQLGGGRVAEDRVPAQPLASRANPGAATLLNRLERPGHLS
jgi:hypothetical protein